MEDSPTEMIFKIIIIGDLASGKTNILAKYLTNTFEPNSTPTIGVEMKVKDFKIKEDLVKAQFWDTAGQEKYDSLTTSYYKGSKGALIVYDITQKESFDNIKGYNVYEVLLCFSIIHFGYAINETFFRGIDKFEDLIIDGSLDRFLVRPQGILFQVLCSKIDFIKIFRILQSLIVMTIALVNLDIVWNISKVIVLLLMMVASILVFFGLFVLTASYCFITIQGLEVKNLFTDGGKNLAQYPISIYRKGIVFFYSTWICICF